MAARIVSLCVYADVTSKMDEAGQRLLFTADENGNDVHPEHTLIATAARIKRERERKKTQNLVFQFEFSAHHGDFIKKNISYNTDSGGNHDVNNV